jgi:uncharacterized membrane protein HdeD (DUF308 family)
MPVFEDPAGPSFAACLLAFPPAVALHVADEWLGGFPRWARRFGSPGYSDRVYLRAHALALVGASVLAGLVLTCPRPWLVFAFVSLWFGPGVSCNAIFHLGASLHTRTHCAGVFTGLTLYLPLSLCLYAAALREGALSPRALAAALAIAALFHAFEVRWSVFGLRGFGQRASPALRGTRARLE